MAKTQLKKCVTSRKMAKTHWEKTSQLEKYVRVRINGSQLENKLHLEKWLTLIGYCATRGTVNKMGVT